MIQVNVQAAGQAYDPYWKRMICADRAGLSGRADVREHLLQTVRECGFESLRQHGMFHDDMFVWPEQDKEFNLQYLFSNYDYYLSLGIRPFVELSFLPKWLASDDKTVFTSKCPACPPKDLKAWHRLVQTTVKQCVARYGLDEVRSWNFEVWNEPNIPFWSGTQAQYFELYRYAAEAVKSVDADLRIGGPATANYTPVASGEYRPVWVEDFMAFCVREKLPVDFISTHPYPTDFPFDDATKKWRRVMRGRDATWQDLTLLRQIMDASPFPHVAIHANEWGTSPGNRDRTHDHVFSATFHCENLLRCIGLVDSLARWDLTDISEEAPPGFEEFHGGWGIQSVHGLKKPDFHAYSFLNRCGGTLLYNDWREGAAVFRSSASRWQVLLYNHHHYADPEGAWETPEGIAAMIGPGEARRFSLKLDGLPPRVRVRTSQVDRDHGWVEKAWRDLGAPTWPTPAQLTELRRLQEPAVSTRTLDTQAGTLTLAPTVPDLGMLFLEIEKV